MSRLWIDANVILRFLTKDLPEMAERSARLMANAERGEVSLYIPPLVLVEVIWVLKPFYRYSMTAIAHVIISLVSACPLDRSRQPGAAHSDGQADSRPERRFRRCLPAVSGGRAR